MFEITNPITNERLQIAENDFENAMDWVSATNTCMNLKRNIIIKMKNSVFA